MDYSERMGLSAGRFRRVLLAWLALAGMAVMSAGPLAAGHPVVDTDCAPAVTVEHDHAAHRIGAAPGPDADHCVACHLTRQARWASTPAVTLAPASASRLIMAGCDHAPRRSDRRPDPTRGPPSLA